VAKSRAVLCTACSSLLGSSWLVPTFILTQPLGNPRLELAAQLAGDHGSFTIKVQFAVAEKTARATPEPATFLSSPKAPCGAGHS